MSCCDADAQITYTKNQSKEIMQNLNQLNQNFLNNFQIIQTTQPFIYSVPQYSIESINRSIAFLCLKRIMNIHASFHIRDGDDDDTITGQDSSVIYSSENYDVS